MFRCRCTATNMTVDQARDQQHFNMLLLPLHLFLLHLHVCPLVGASSYMRTILGSIRAMMFATQQVVYADAGTYISSHKLYKDEE